MKTIHKLSSSNESNLIENLVGDYIALKKDYTLVTKSDLNLDNHRSKNIFPYRGQFSPDLVKNLVENFANSHDVILDPFVGCGTVLFQSIKKGHGCFGVEINPTGLTMASTCLFANVDKAQREKIHYEIVSESNKILGKYLCKDTFQEELLNYIKFKRADLLFSSILENAYLRYRNTGENRIPLISFLNAVEKQVSLINALPYINSKVGVFNADARNIPLMAGSVDLVITSPPYINVFNYHQHFRSIMEELGWNVLSTAKSEIGSNRKHRSNRLYTVIQYMLDMIEVFFELKRVIKIDSRIIIVIGRTSNVRKTSFRNDLILVGVGKIAGFSVIEHQERMFINKFGETIFEDIIHFKAKSKSLEPAEEICKAFARYILENSLKHAPNQEVQFDFYDAIEKIDTIKKSELLNLENTRSQLL